MAFATSLLKTGGVGTITPTNNSFANAVVLFDAGVQTNVVLTPDGAACNAYTITNNGTAGEPWLWIHINGMHKGSQGVPIFPGERVPFIEGSNANGINTIYAWTTSPAPNQSANAATTLTLTGGIQRQN